MTMVDRVAAALCELARLPLGPSWEDLRDGERAYLRKHARAAIEAMREPTDWMVECGAAWIKVLDQSGDDFVTCNAWRSMIDATFSEEKTP